MAKFNEWTDTAWPYNSAIKIPCIVKSCKKNTGYSVDVYLHKSFKCVDTEANGGTGLWEQGEGFDFTVRKQYSRRCPDEIKTLEEAKVYVEKYVESH